MPSATVPTALPAFAALPFGREVGQTALTFTLDPAAGGSFFKLSNGVRLFFCP